MGLNGKNLDKGEQLKDNLLDTDASKKDSDQGPDSRIFL